MKKTVLSRGCLTRVVGLLSVGLICLTTFSTHSIAQFAPGAQMIATLWNPQNSGESGLVFIDLTTNQVTKTIDLGFVSAHDIAVSPDYTLAYVSEQGQGTDPATDYVRVINVATQTIFGAIASDTPRDMFVTDDGTIGYVAEMNGDAVGKFELSSFQRVKTISSGNGPWVLEASSDGTYLYETGVKLMDVAVIDLATDEVVDSIVLEAGSEGPDVPEPGQVPGLALSPDGKVAYANAFSYAGAWTSTFFVIDTDPQSPTFHSVIKTLPMPPGLLGQMREIAFEPGGEFAYVTVETGGFDGPSEFSEIIVVDAATHEFIQIVEIGRRSWRVDFLPDGSLAYASNNFSNSISIIDTSTHSVIGTIAVPGKPKGMVVIPPNVVTALESESDLPDGYTLHQNYPNPFNPETTLTFDIPEDSHVAVTVVDALGRTVGQLLNKLVPAGTHSINFDGSRLTGGTYMVRLTTPKGSQSRKMVLLK